MVHLLVARDPPAVLTADLADLVGPVVSDTVPLPEVLRVSVTLVAPVRVLGALGIQQASQVQAGFTIMAALAVPVAQ